MPEKKVKSSLFFITINSNHTVTSLQQAGKLELFEEICDAITSEQEIRNWSIIHAISRQPVDPKDIISVERIAFGIETGTNKHMKHAHAVLRIRHTSFIQLNVKDLQMTVRNALGLGKNIYLDCRGLNDQAETLAQYTMKWQERVSSQ